MAGMATDLKPDEKGFSLIEFIVALTLLATALIGTYALLGSNSTQFTQTSLRGQMQNIADSILTDIQMRYAAGLGKSSVSNLTAATWSGFLSDNGLTPSDVTLSFTDLAALSTYRISTYNNTTRQLVITSTSPGTILPLAGDKFQIDAGKYICEVEAVSGTAGNLTLTHGAGCNLSGLTVNTNTLFFGELRVSLSVRARNGDTLSQQRQLIAAW
ncbi:MAG: type IV pilus modification PilV family protein [Parvibaculales bacterium]